MTGEIYRIKGYWQSGPAGTRDCAARLAHMVDGLAKAHPAFAGWKRKAKTRGAANQRAWAMPPDIEELTAVFEKARRYKDAPPEPWPEMGYSVSVWNGLVRPYGASLTVRPGAYGDFIRFPNTVELTLNPAGMCNTDFVCAAVLKPVLLSLATAWQPNYGGVVSWEYWERAFAGRHYPLFRSGWMTYLAPQYAGRITAPPAAFAEPVAGGGMLLLATQERFSMDNPEQLAAADAIQAALAPLQNIFP